MLISSFSVTESDNIHYGHIESLRGQLMGRDFKILFVATLNGKTIKFQLGGLDCIIDICFYKIFNMLQNNE